jgi:hypothetical protein
LPLELKDVLYTVPADADEDVVLSLTSSPKRGAAIMRVLS